MKFASRGVSDVHTIQLNESSKFDSSRPVDGTNEGNVLPSERDDMAIVYPQPGQGWGGFSKAAAYVSARSMTKPSFPKFAALAAAP